MFKNLSTYRLPSKWEMTLMTGELNLMLTDIVAALGGEVGDLASPARAA